MIRTMDGKELELQNMQLPSIYKFKCYKICTNFTPKTFLLISVES